MKRELIFDTSKAENRFKTIWAAMAFIPPQGMPRGAEVLRREANITRKLRSISETKSLPAEENLPERKERTLKEGEQKIILYQVEIDLIRTRIEAYPYWNPIAEEPVSDVYDWLNTGQEVEEKV